MKCKKCKKLTGDELTVHLFSTHGLSFLAQGVEETEAVKELWEKQKQTGKKSIEKFEIK